MLRKSFVALSFCALAFPALAETLGTITATIDGGEERRWYITRDGETSQSGWQRIMPGSLTGSSFSLWGNPTEEGGDTTKDVLILGAVLMPGAGGMTTVPDLQYLEEYFSKYWNAEEDTTKMTLVSVEEAGDMLSVSGEFTSTATYGEGVGNLDPSKTMVIEGRFEAVVPLN